MRSIIIVEVLPSLEQSLAVEYLTNARAGFKEIGLDPDRIEAQAVEARALLSLGRHEEAHSLAKEVFQYLRENGTEGLNSPALLYVCAADVLNEIEMPGISPREVIEAGYRDLLQRAERISDPEWRKSFLENVDENREIVERWEKLTK